MSQGIIDLLNKLDEQDLIALAKTITQNLLKFNSKEDALRGILKHSPNELSILRRKAITRDFLFTYLDEQNIPIKLPITKNELIDRVVDYWNIPKPSNTLQRTENESQQLENSNKDPDNNINALAYHFAEWFYKMMNSEGVGPEHFYSDAKLKISLISDGDCDTTVVENNPQDISHSLFQIKLKHNLFFNPNISKEGVQGRMDPHGLVMVLVCGTLHIQEVCAGVFEQVFSLARDPFCDNNWKIKNCELNLRSKSGIVSQPRLCDSDLTSNLLMLPSE